MKKSSNFVCQNCGYQVSKWMGRCPECNEWNTFEEEIPLATSTKKIATSSEVPMKIAEIERESYERVKTGIHEFDRVVGGGVVNGSLILIGGEPGIGKSTILTTVVGKLAETTHENVMYVSGEESVGQVADRTKRLGIDSDNVYIYHETIWQNILTQIKTIKPRYLVIDSIQTTTSNEVASPPGTMSQIREVTYELMNHVKAMGITCFVIGHITKEGAIAGPKILEHMVDTVIYFEGDQFGNYRMLRAIKNRFGNTNEVGIFEMGEHGLNEVKNPSQFFLEEKLEGSFGRALSAIVEGSRTIFVEIQALVVENQGGYPRRTTQGVDQNRLAMLVAIIEKYFGLPISSNDIYLNVVGGIKLDSRETDLAIIAALLSSYRGRAISDDTIFMGEVGLTGEVRSIPQVEMRLKEMSQLNYKKVITSRKIAKTYNGQFRTELIGIAKAADLENALF